MNMHVLSVIISIAVASHAYATERKDEDRVGASPLKGDYYMYGGTLGEMTPPTSRDRKVAFMFKGPLAKAMFHQIGPDVKNDNACSSDTAYRERRRGDLACTFEKDDGYSCYFGLNVITGKGTYGMIC